MGMEVGWIFRVLDASIEYVSYVISKINTQRVSILMVDQDNIPLLSFARDEDKALKTKYTTWTL